MKTINKSLLIGALVITMTGCSGLELDPTFVPTTVAECVERQKFMTRLSFAESAATAVDVVIGVASIPVKALKTVAQREVTDTYEGITATRDAACKVILEEAGVVVTR